MNTDRLSHDAILTADQTYATRLTYRVKRAGDLEWEEEHDLGSGLVTNAGVNLLSADWTNTTATLKLSNYHDCGTGTTPAAVTDTALQTPYGGARAVGTQSNPSSNVYKTVATITFAGTFAITEWGLFTATSAGTLWDHKVFAAINVNSGDSIQFSYSLTNNSGG